MLTHYFIFLVTFYTKKNFTYKKKDGKLSSYLGDDSPSIVGLWNSLDKTQQTNFSKQIITSVSQSVKRSRFVRFNIVRLFSRYRK